MEEVKDQNENYQKVFMATAPNQVWTWDITWLKGPIKGLYFPYLYLIIDIFSRKIVAWEIWETEDAIYAEELLKEGCH
ncbi:DDE-type integrase/transposase/recombinase [Anaerobacillus sp. HL2]|nr:DDE-type integrase/transposase/recombinase [Anaerobacillus sp. HL2]